MSTLRLEPVVEEIVDIIIARGETTSESIEHYLRANDDETGVEVYQKFVAPAVNAFEDAVQRWEGSI